MAKMDWAKAKRDTQRRRPAPQRPNPTRRIQRATFPSICPACDQPIKPLDQITPVTDTDTEYWVHWTKATTCARRQEGRIRKAHPKT